MKTVRMLLIMVLVLVGLEGVARSKTSIHVYGADDPAVDVQAVQDAVDTYDKVHLHGTFDFGKSTVSINHSVEILGEGTDADGDYLTRIEGDGWQALLSSVVNPDVEWAVREIEFEGASVSIQTRASKRFEVTGCSISPITTGFFGLGIQLNGNDVTGSATIKDNYIDVSGAAILGCGVMSDGVFADIEIVGNTVENFSLTGLWVNSAGNIEIRDNTINAGTPGPGGYRNGILVGSWWLEGDKGNIEVTDNTITTGGHQSDSGIAVEDWYQEVRAVCKVADNVITYVDDSPSGSAILLLSRASNWTFEDNAINGGGHELLAGIALYPGISGEPGPQEYNIFSDNHVSHADFVLGGVYVDSSAQASYNEFVRNEFEHIGGDGFFIDGDYNLLLKNKLKDVTGDGIILKGDYNMVHKNKFHDIVGQNIVDEGVGNIIGDND